MAASAPASRRRGPLRAALFSLGLGLIPAAASPPAFSVAGAPWSGGPRLALDGRGERLELVATPEGWSARVSPPGGPAREVRSGPAGLPAVLPLAGGFLLAESDAAGVWSALHATAGPGAPVPVSGARAPVVAAGAAGEWFAAALHEGALRIWRRAGAGWAEEPRPAVPAGARPLALVAGREGLVLAVGTASGWSLWQRAGAGWREHAGPGAGPTPVALVAARVGAAHLGFAVPGEPGPLWLWHPVTRAWAAPSPGEGVVPAGPAAGAGLAVIAGPADARTAGALALAPRRPEFGAINYATLGAYLVAMMGLGAYFMRRARDARSYFLAGGRIPWWAAGISVYATTLSSITVLAMPAKSFATDWTFLLAPLTILLLAPVITRFYLPFFRRLEVASAYEYLERRFSFALRAYASVVFVCFQLGRVAIVTYLPSLALATVCGLDVVACVLLIGGLCTVYTVLGGIEGSIWTSVLQAGVMLSAALLCLGALLGGAGGGVAALAAEAAADGKLRLVDWSWSAVQATTWIIVLGNLINNLVPYTSDQSVIQRYLTTTDEAQARRAIWLNGLIAFPSATLYFALGTGLYLFFKHHPEALHPAIAGESLLPFFVADHLPAGLAGLVVAGIFAAAQSNVSSDLNSGATALVTDFVERGRPGLSARARLRWARGATAGLGGATTGLALLLTTLDIRSFLDAYISLVGLMGTGLAAVFALGIFTTRANAAGALAGVVASGAVLLWVQQATRLHFFWYGLVGFATCAAVALAVAAAGGARRPLTGLTLWTLPPRGPAGPA